MSYEPLTREETLAAYGLRRPDEFRRHLNMAEPLREPPPEQEPPPLPDRHDEIATLMRTLTYGEMMDIAESMWRAAAALAPHDQPEPRITQQNLPAVLHRWATARP